MTDTDSYRATLVRLQRDLAEAQGRIPRLQAGIAAIQELIDGEDATNTRPSPGVTLRQLMEHDPRMSTATMEDAAVIAFETAKRPMRVRELYETMMAMGYRYNRGFDVFKGSMIPLLRRKPQFEKQALGLYGLRAQ